MGGITMTGIRERLLLCVAIALLVASRSLHAGDLYKTETIKGDTVPMPKPAEVQLLSAHPDKKKEAYEDILWALVNAKEFQFND